MEPRRSTGRRKAKRRLRIRLASRRVGALQTRGVPPTPLYLRNEANGFRGLPVSQDVDLQLVALSSEPICHLASFGFVRGVYWLRSAKNMAWFGQKVGSFGGSGGG